MKIEINTDLENVKFPIIIKDKRGNVIYYQYKDGFYNFWLKYTYDEKNNQLTGKTSSGFWY